MRRNFVFGMASAVFAWTVGMAFASKPEELVEFPVSDNLRGHENIEWSTSYAFGLTDASRKLPRVLLVGDSICGGYKDGVRDGLKGRGELSGP